MTYISSATLLLPTTAWDVNYVATTMSDDSTHPTTINFIAQQDGTQITILHGHTGAVTHLAYRPDGRFIATASEDGTARIWDSATGQELFTIQRLGGVHGRGPLSGASGGDGVAGASGFVG